jgi:hypothetical protein
MSEVTKERVEGIRVWANSNRKPHINPDGFAQAIDSLLSYIDQLTADAGLETVAYMSQEQTSLWFSDIGANAGHIPLTALLPATAQINELTKERDELRGAANLILKGCADEEPPQYLDTHNADDAYDSGYATCGWHLGNALWTALKQKGSV